MKCVVNLVGLNTHIIEVDEKTTLENAIEVIGERVKLLLRKGCFVETVKPGGNVRFPAPRAGPILPVDDCDNYFRLVAKPELSQVLVHQSFLEEDAIRPSTPLLVKVDRGDTVRHIKQKLEGQSGVPVALQNICRQDGHHTLEQYTLLSHGILDNDHLFLSLKFAIQFWFEGKAYNMECLSDGALSSLLKRFAAEHGRSCPKLRYLIGQASGIVADSATEWLPERDCLFDAESAVGSIEANGLYNDDEIHVFRVNCKRQRSDEERDPPADRPPISPGAYVTVDIDEAGLPTPKLEPLPSSRTPVRRNQGLVKNEPQSR